MKLIVFNKNIDLKFLLIYLTIILSIIITLVFKKIFFTNLESNWATIEKEKNQEISKNILNDVYNFQKAIYEGAFTIANDSLLKTILTQSNINKKEKVFSYLSRISEVDNYQIIDKDFRIVAWNGKRNYVLKKNDIKFINNDTSFIFSGSIYSYYIHIRKIITDTSSIYFLVTNKILMTNYNLNNRYIKNTGLETELQNKYNIPIKFYINKLPIHKKGFLIKQINYLDGNKLGFIEFSGINKDFYLEKIDNYFNIIIYSLIVLFIILLCYESYRFFTTNLKFYKLLIFTLILWSIRYFFILTGYFSVISESEIFTRKYFSNYFGYGLTDSLGDLSLTLIFLLINIFYLVYFFQKKEKKSTIYFFSSPPVVLFIIILIDIIIMLLLRGFGASLRTIAFETTIKIYNFSSILPSFPLGLTYINIFLLGFSVFLTILFLIFQQFYIIKFKNKNFQFILLILLIITNLIYNYIEKNKQVDPYIQIITLVISFLLAYSSYHNFEYSKKLFNIKNTFITSLLSLLLTFIILNQKIESKQKFEIERKGDELIRPIDDYITYIMNRTMSEIAIDEKLPILLSSFDETSNYDEAFIRWLNSPLSQEKYNSAFIIFNKNGKLVSQFSVGVFDNEIKYFSKDIQNINQSLINIFQTGNSSLKHYIGIEPIYNKNQKIGNVMIIVASDENIFLRNNIPDYIRTYSIDEKFPEMQNIIISEFYNSQLIFSTNTIYSKEQKLSQDVINNLTSTDNHKKGIWQKELINEKEFNSYYLSANIKQPLERVYSISIENLDLRWHIYNFFKILITNLCLILFLLILFLLFKLIRKDKLYISFRTKILLSLLFIAIAPMIILWFYTETYIKDQNQKQLIRTLSNDIDIIGNNLLRHFKGVIDSNSLIKNLSFNDARMISESSGRDFNIYLGDSLIISSRPELFKTELVNRYISSDAYINLYVYGKNFFYENANIGDFPYLVGYVPITSTNGKTIGTLSLPIMYKDTLIERDLAQSLAFIFGGYIIVLFIIVIVGYYLSKIISTPIKNLKDATSKIISGNLDTKIPVIGNDEISDLIISFNKMTEELKRSQLELAKAEREAAWKEMARQVAHEIKNPLTPMKLSIQHLQKVAKDKAENFDEVFNRVTKTLVEQIDTLSKIVSNFSNFAKMPDRNIDKCNIKDIILEAINLFKDEKYIDFETKFCDNIKVIEGDKEELRRVFINIIRNSIQAIHSKESKSGKITIETEYKENKQIIRIIDDGIGLNSDLIPKIFDENFSTKKDGMGIGLKISRKTIKDMGGEIYFKSEKNKGSIVEIVI